MFLYRDTVGPLYHDTDFWNLYNFVSFKATMTKDTSKRSAQQGLQLLPKALCPKMSSSIFQKITGIFGNLKTLLSK